MVWHTSTLIDSDPVHDYYGFRNLGGKIDLISLYSIQYYCSMKQYQKYIYFPIFVVWKDIFNFTYWHSFYKKGTDGRDINSIRQYKLVYDELILIMH